LPAAAGGAVTIAEPHTAALAALTAMTCVSLRRPLADVRHRPQLDTTIYTTVI